MVINDVFDSLIIIWQAKPYVPKAPVFHDPPDQKFLKHTVLTLVFGVCFRVSNKCPLNVFCYSIVRLDSSDSNFELFHY
jgi:hypothetical protein